MPHTYVSSYTPLVKVLGRPTHYHVLGTVVLMLVGTDSRKLSHDSVVVVRPLPVPPRVAGCCLDVL